MRKLLASINCPENTLILVHPFFCDDIGDSINSGSFRNFKSSNGTRVQNIVEFLRDFKGRKVVLEEKSRVSLTNKLLDDISALNTVLVDTHILNPEPITGWGSFFSYLQDKKNPIYVGGSIMMDSFTSHGGCVGYTITMLHHYGYRNVSFLKPLSLVEHDSHSSFLEYWNIPAVD